ncbi:WGxxGxxG family protein [Scytonema sp. PCC 10023]|uniref:WGxxGxxG family protein n=1 Tax=Scytonema sp. PCC 10023 TaxID=1680591 RepID=UPI0039C60C2E
MLRVNLFKMIGVATLTLSTAIMPLTLPATAQVEPGVGGPYEQTGIYEDDDFDWGWLGLIGLVGLFGLAGKSRRQEPTAYREPDTVHTGYRD